MSRLLRGCYSLVAVVSFVLAMSGRTLACEFCRQFGTTAYHNDALNDRLHPSGAVGGDDMGDAWQPPSKPTSGVNEGGLATAQFVVQGGSFFQPGGRGTPATITYSYNNLLDGGIKDIDGISLPVSLIRGSIQEAFRVWAQHVPLNFVEVPDQGGGPFLNDYPNGQFGEIRFSHVYINGPDIPGSPPIAKAMAYFHGYGGNLASDVFFDHSDPWQEVGTTSQPDILGAAIHEIGHTLGLGHTDLVGANMYWIFHRFSGLGSGQLFQDDIDGIQSIYGAGVGSVTPLAVPEPTTLVLVGIALSSLGLVRRQRRPA